MSRRSREDRKKDVNDILEWIRNKKEDSMDATGEYKKVDEMLPEKPWQKPKDRARDIEAALDWMRNKGVKPHDEDIPMFEKPGSVPRTVLGGQSC